MALETKSARFIEALTLMISLTSTTRYTMQPYKPTEAIQLEAI